MYVMGLKNNTNDNDKKTNTIIVHQTTHQIEAHFLRMQLTSQLKQMHCDWIDV